MLCIFYTNIFHSPTIWYKRGTQYPPRSPLSAPTCSRLFVLLPKVIMPWHSVYSALCCILCGWLKLLPFSLYFFVVLFFCIILLYFFLYFPVFSCIFLHFSVLFCLKNFKRVIFAICLIAKSQRSRRRLWMATMTVSNDERDRGRERETEWELEAGYLASQSHARTERI